MEMYFLKSAACLAILLLFYKLLLERENMHVFKRFYLLASLVAATAIPFITFTTYTEPSGEMFVPVLISSEVTPGAASVNYWPYLLTGIYFTGVLFFSIKFIKNLHDILLKINKNPKIRNAKITNVLLSEKIPPHTFFNYIFFNKQEFLCNKIPQDVKVHEEAHAREKHSLDVMLMELLQIIFWINPLIFLLKNAIKLNHEFLADRAVLRHGYPTKEYQQTLLSYSSGDLQSDLVNPINYSSIKKRFKVMKTKTSQTVILGRGFLLLPLLAVLVYGFSTKEVVERDIENASLVIGNPKVLELSVDKAGSIFLNNKKTELSEINKLEMEKYKSYSINASPEAPENIIKALVQFGARNQKAGTVSVCNVTDLKSDNNDRVNGELKQSPQQKKATPEEISEYNRLVKHYNEMPENKRVVKQEDANKIMSILNRMSPEQKEKAEKINFKVPPPPPPAPAPTPAKGEDLPPLPSPVEVIGYPAPPPTPAKADQNLPPLPPTVEVQGYPKPPPPPPPPTYEDLVEKGATFYYNDKQITPEEARRLVEVEKKVNIQIIDIDKKPIVKLTDKE